MRSLDRLMLTVGLLDRISGPLRAIQRTVDRVTSHSRRAFMNTAAGVTALIAASTAFATTINPANDMNQALGEVRSLEVAESTLASLNQAGLKYSIQFGAQASNYVRSAYDIQSAIDGLVDNDLPRFTTAAGTLAKATKANVSDITSYFGSMYGIFKNQANEMGKGTWVEMLAGQTATAVQMFKTTGPEMSAAFESIGADAQSMGIKLNEQMGVLGTLQSTMSGSEAGTKYGAFLGSLGNAQDNLDLKFTDQSGALLPVVEILEKIKTQTNGLGALETQNLLADAFGSDEAVSFIQLMSADIGKLNSDINKLGKVEGMEKAIWMAEQMQDPWARLGAGIKAVSIAVWQKALPAINPFVDAMSQVTLVIVEWTDKYPNLTKAIGLGITAFMGLIAVAGLMTLAIGLVQFAGVGLTMRFLIIRPVVWAARAVMMAYTASLWLMRTAILAFVLYGPAISTFFMAMKASFLTTLPAIWAFTSALLANPITWIVVGIAALIAALVAVVVYWDDVTAAINRFTDYVFEGLASGWNWIKNLFAENAWLKLAFWPIFLAIEFVESLVASFDLISQWWGGFKGQLVELDPFAVLSESFNWVLDSIASSWSGLKDTFESNTWMKVVFAPIYIGIKAIDSLIESFDLISQWWGDFSVYFASLVLLPNFNISTDIFEPLKAWWMDFKNWLGELDPFAFLGDSVDWMKDKLSWIPSLDFNSTQEVKQKVESEQTNMNGLVNLPGSETAKSENEGGLFQTISNLFGGSSKSTHIEKIEVNNQGQAMRGDELAHEMEMQVG